MKIFKDLNMRILWYRNVEVKADLQKNRGGPEAGAVGWGLCRVSTRFQIAREQVFFQPSIQVTRPRRLQRLPLTRIVRPLPDR